MKYSHGKVMFLTLISRPDPTSSSNINIYCKGTRSRAHGPDPTYSIIPPLEVGSGHETSMHVECSWVHGIGKGRLNNKLLPQNKEK